MDREKVKIKKGESIKRGDHLLMTALPNGRTIQKAIDKSNCYAFEDLTNIDGTVYMNIRTGAVYNNPIPSKQLLFSQRKKIADSFEKWRQDMCKRLKSNISNEPINVIAFLDQQGLLNV